MLSIVLTCHHRFRVLKPDQDVLDKADIGAGLQIAYTFAQNRYKNAPYFSLQEKRKEKGERRKEIYEKWSGERENERETRKILLFFSMSVGGVG